MVLYRHEMKISTYLDKSNLITMRRYALKMIKYEVLNVNEKAKLVLVRY